VDDLATAREIERQAAAHGKTVPVHLKIDTGMNRLGVRAEEAAAAAAAIAGMKHLVLEGAYTHFACADLDGHEATGGQLGRFRRALDAMRAAGAVPPLVHAANSSALIAVAEAHFDMVRPGLALYGIRPCPAARSVPLVPALSLKSRVVHLKRVRAGEATSYGHTWSAKQDSVLGLLPIGYADGYPRALSNCGMVRVAGRLCPVVGTVCMDATLVDLTGVPRPEVGMAATLIEAASDSPLGAEAVAGLCRTIPYEILTGIGRRVPRVYVEGTSEE
jgi:alanine racemase